MEARERFLSGLRCIMSEVRSGQPVKLGSCGRMFPEQVVKNSIDKLIGPRVRVRFVDREFKHQKQNRTLKCSHK
jgi:hypothetical protein